MWSIALICILFHQLVQEIVTTVHVFMNAQCTEVNQDKLSYVHTYVVSHARLLHNRKWRSSLVMRQLPVTYAVINGFRCIVPDEDLCVWNVVPLRSLFATWMLKTIDDYVYIWKRSNEPLWYHSCDMVAKTLATQSHCCIANYVGDDVHM